MTLLDYFLGPTHRFRCMFGHQFFYRGKHISRFQWCPLCHEEGKMIEAREIPQEQTSAKTQ